MSEMVRRLVWFTIIASIIAYTAYLAAGSFVEAKAAESPVVVRDNVGPNEHQLSGMVMVPSSCYELMVRTAQLSRTDFQLIFTTWLDPSITCKHPTEVPREFHAMLFAPAAGVHISALLDDKDIPIAVIPTVTHHSTTTPME